ncbi:MAG: hypothetical protein LH610_11060 [Sphingomonas bacterium]|nr:hypothetical protein [Sphingomonas bacterium]
MILIVLLAAVAGMIAYFVAAQLSHFARVVIAILVFLIPPLAVTALVVMVGDQAALGDVTIAADEKSL